METSAFSWGYALAHILHKRKQFIFITQCICSLLGYNTADFKNLTLQYCSSNVGAISKNVIISANCHLGHISLNVTYGAQLLPDTS